jgi:hypothetical protein
LIDTFYVDASKLQSVSAVSPAGAGDPRSLGGPRGRLHASGRSQPNCHCELSPRGRRHTSDGFVGLLGRQLWSGDTVELNRLYVAAEEGPFHAMEIFGEAMARATA